MEEMRFFKILDNFARPAHVKVVSSDYSQLGEASVILSATGWLQRKLKSPLFLGKLGDIWMPNRYASYLKMTYNGFRSRINQLSSKNLIELDKNYLCVTPEGQKRLDSTALSISIPGQILEQEWTFSQKYLYAVLIRYAYFDDSLDLGVVPSRSTLFASRHQIPQNTFYRNLRNFKKQGLIFERPDGSIHFKTEKRVLETFSKVTLDG
jgi:hypothetical protein